MIKLKFWQRIYLSIFTLLFIALTIIISVIGYNSHQQYALAVINQAKAAHTELERAVSFELYKKQQMIDLSNQKIDYVSLRNYYKTDTQFLVLSSGEEIQVSTFFKQYETKILEVIKENPESINFITINNKEYILLTKNIKSSYDNLKITYIQDFSNVNNAWKEQLFLSITIGVGVSVVLLIGLFFVVKKFTKPLELINNATNEFAVGNYDVRLSLKQNDEFKKIADSFNNMAVMIEKNVKELEALSIQKQEMVNNIAHEIRTPLTNIQGYGELLLNARIGEDKRYEMTVIIIEESKKLKMLSSKMLELGQLQSQEIEYEKINLVLIIKKAIQSVEKKSKDKKITIIVKGKTDVFMYGDDILLQSLFVNLLDNALNSMDNAGLIQVSIETKETLCSVEILDQGVGMTEKQMDQLGNPFYRIDKSRSRTQGGHGLGVSLCYQIVQSHKGQISYTSKNKQGTKVTITFNI